MSHLLIAAVFDGIGMALMSGNNSALLHETLVSLGRGSEFAHQFGRLQAWHHIAAFIAAFVGGVLASIELRWAAYATVPSLLIATGATCLLTEPDRHIDKAGSLVGHVGVALRALQNNRRLTLIALASMLSGGVGIAMFQLRPAWTSELWPIWAVSAARALAAVLAALGTWWGGAIVNRFGALRATVVVQSVSSVVDIAALVGATVISPALLTSSSFAFGIGTTADGVLLQREFTDDQRATLGSFVGVGTRAIFAVTALGFGLLAAHITMALVIGELLLICAAGLYFWVFRTQKRPARVERYSYVSG